MKSQIADLLPRCESISRQLRAWADSLQNSPIPGQRHLTDHTRRQYDQSRRAQEFLEKLDRIRRGQTSPPDTSEI